MITFERASGDGKILINPNHNHISAATSPEDGAYCTILMVD